MQRVRQPAWNHRHVVRRQFETLRGDAQFTVAFDPAGRLPVQYGVQGMPSSVFVDRSGKVRYVHRGYQPGDESKYADMVRSLVKE